MQGKGMDRGIKFLKDVFVHHRKWCSEDKGTQRFYHGSVAKVWEIGCKYIETSDVYHAETIAIGLVTLSPKFVTEDDRCSRASSMEVQVPHYEAATLARWRMCFCC